ncbi:acyl-CoA dehydrogenase [Dasania sp. GY-MA-18]|uniref:Acyl-coenzyme A dehydrogenase n=1 Tax=Dasania phycosphaerae TaxID=2950436 RepID=A0A9J6RJR2_9GAMM|nr:MULTISPECIES: acyl-CoA dehydrogenase [Dasania]MCR8922214.1 acyl-CoA dehydrogenase [Dasania sp. GY-MA-18]MCZ0864642.1 acyl-CoA dehydrogenase [Dasania phycosphaerae]MCZ0868370.1 acyl-CoA dehydrogenase [Dasania phycosphaerae]
MLLLLLFLGLILTLIYWGINRYLWIGFFVACALAYSLWWPQASWLGAAMLWLIAAAAVFILGLPQLRRQFISRPVFLWAGKILPELSSTEREALEAGTVGWDGELFSGDPDWQSFLDTPKPSLSSEEQAFIDGPTEQLCQMLDDWRITHEHKDLPAEVWTFIKEQGFLGMIIPKSYGGLGMSALAHSTVVMKISTRSITAAVTVMVPNSLGPAELLMVYGTDEQRQHYLPRLACGDDIPCFGLTSTQAGSDAGAIIDQGIVCKRSWQGQDDVLGLSLTWSKRYITLAPVATVLGLAFKAYDPDNLLGDEPELGVTCALIPTDLPGVNTGNRHWPLETPFMNGPTSGEDVFIPLDYIIGGSSGIGRGWSMLMNCLSVGRSVSLPALSTGAGKLACLTTGAYSRIREQFNSPIGYFEGVEEALAPIAALTYLMDSARVLTVSFVDNKEKPSVLSAVLKYHNTETMRRVVDHAMDIHGGRGIICGPRNYLANAYKSVPISITVEGANILTRNLMIFGQGSIRCHPYLLQEMQAIQNDNPELGLMDFDQALFAHLGHALRLKVRSVWLGLSCARFVFTPKNSVAATKPYFKQLTRLSADFAFVSDVTLALLGGELKFKERTSARLGDGLSYLYLASAILKRYHDDGCPAEDEPLMHWSMQYCIYQLQQALFATLANYPVKYLGGMLRFALFPYGRCYSLPSDSLDKQAAAILLSQSVSRDRLVAGVYRNEDPNDPVGRVENAFALTLAAAAASKKIKAAIKQGKLHPLNDTATLAQQAVAGEILSTEEAELYTQALAAVDDAIQVDDFEKDFFTKG